ncbi:glycogen synthase GlgA [Olivibacter ginsenosidimutans]|uniref:Glycogen synthase n=1 Tax=Olivibacter ginsenosidimutans TaxID=1176537 RepID=A0ABP9B5X4_9SPHI
MHVIHFAAECYPVAKVGGLADVLGALPKYQQKAGQRTSVVLPFYNKPFVQEHRFVPLYEGMIQQGDKTYPYTILKEDGDSLGFELLLVQIPQLLDRAEIYGYADESEQFLAYQHAALDWLCACQIRPDIIHCHDHHAGLIPFYMEYVPQFQFLKGIPTVATVHNGQYQGWMHWHMASFMPSFDTWRWGLLDWDGLINPLAALIKCCWAYTAVSEGYLHELYSKANGLESLFYAEQAKSYGIVNGIDKDVWNPTTDPMLSSSFNLVNVNKGKQANKTALCQQFQLPDNLPLFVFIGRFALEKGADLLPDAIRHMLQQHPGQVNFVVLGSGDAIVEQSLQAISIDFPQHFGLYIGYNETLAHQIYAAADYLLMPSRVEPCGLNQLYAMRYGTIPVVHATGGLKDTVKDLATADGYGMLFTDATVDATIEALERAWIHWQETTAKMKTQLRKQLMKLDFSWEKSTTKYNTLYKQLTN